MKGKIGFEEHFAIEETLEATRSFAGDSGIWDVFTRQILDLDDERLEHMDKTGIELAILSLNSPGVQGILDADEAMTVAKKGVSPHARFWSWVVWVGLFLALGEFNPFYKWVYWGFPPVRILRYPEKYLFFCAFGFTFLAAWAIDAVARRNGGEGVSVRRILGGTGVLAVLAGVCGLAFPFRPLAGQLAIVLILGAVMLLLVRGILRPQIGAPLLLLLVLLDLGLHNWQLPPMTHRSLQEGTPLLAKAIAPGHYRVFSGRLHERDVSLTLSLPSPNLMAGQVMNLELLRPYTGMRHGLEYPNGLAGIGLEAEDPQLWMQVLEASPYEKRRLILQRSNVRYWVNWDLPVIFVHRPENPEDHVPLITPQHLQEFEKPLPRAFLVGRARHEPPVFLLNTYYDKKFDPLREVLLIEPSPLAESADFSGTVQSLQYDHNSATVRTRQNAPGWLVLLDSYFPGWTATVDGRPQKIFKANQFFRAVPLAAGDHTVRFRYEPVGWRLGLGLFGLSTLLAAACALAIRLKARGGPGAGSAGPVLSN